MQFIPEENQTFKAVQLSVPFDKTLSDINTKLSPILPLHFDKSFLPSMFYLIKDDLCEIEYLKLAECRILNKFKGTNLCSYEVTKYEYCRKNRDIRILDGIKRWQTGHINSLQSADKKMYLQGLTFKMDRLKDEYAKTPSTVSKQIKLMEIENQLQTIKWRMNYIKKLI